MIFAVTVVAVSAFAFWLRTGTKPEIISADELIPLAVSKAMAAHGDLNPNWARADLPGLFKYDSYNFYLYLLFVHPFLSIGRALGIDPLAAGRIVNAVLEMAAAVALYFAAARPSFAVSVRWIAPAIFLFSPAAVQDAHMVRPEAILYLLTALALLATWRTANTTRALILLGAIVGAGTAVKVSFLSTLLLAAPLLLAPGSNRLDRLKRGGLLALATALSFALVAPYAIAHVDVLANGIEKLIAQYEGEHPPHSLVVHDKVRFAWWVASYFLATLGPILVGAFAAPLFAARCGGNRDDYLLLLSAWAAALVVFVYFGSKTVFFERNMAHALPLVSVCAAWLLAQIPGKTLRTALAIAAMAPSLYWSVLVADASRRGENLEEFELRHGITGVKRGFFYNSDEVARSCAVLALFDFGDAFTEESARKLAVKGFREIAYYPSRFEPLPVSTLQVYLEPSVRYLQCPAKPQA